MSSFSPDQLADLLQEKEEVAARRAACLEMRQLLLKAVDILKDVRTAQIVPVNTPIREGAGAGAAGAGAGAGAAGGGSSGDSYDYPDGVDGKVSTRRR